MSRAAMPLVKPLTWGAAAPNNAKNSAKRAYLIFFAQVTPTGATSLRSQATGGRCSGKRSHPPHSHGVLLGHISGLSKSGRTHSVRTPATKLKRNVISWLNRATQIRSKFDLPYGVENAILAAA
jgi:hypothetical protein